MLSKEKVITAINSLPNEFTMEEIIEVLIVLQKVGIGLKQTAEGKVLTTAEAKAYMKSKFPHLER